MEQLYEVKGRLNSGFVGQVTYTTCLPETYAAMDIAFTFEKQHYPDAASVPVRELTDYCRREYGITPPDNEEETRELLLRETKTEIHLMATLNDEFIGCIHKQMPERHMHFSESMVSEGCILPPRLEGVLKVTLLVFNVLMDDTPYCLSISAKKMKGDEKL